MAGYLGAIPVPQATQHRESFTATSGQTTFNTAGYTGFLDVYLNGSHLSPADFTATNGSDVVLASGASTGDVCDIISYTAFEVADQTFTGTTTMTGAVNMASTLQVDGAITSSAGATITTADNSDTLSLVSTDADASVGPNLNLYRNSSSPADNDTAGLIKFQSRNDNSQDVTYSEMYITTPDVSDGSEDGQLHIDTMVAGTSRSRVKLMPAETVFNENSIDLDFRVESNGNANMLFVDGGNDAVVIGHNNANDGSVSSAFSLQNIGTSYNSSSIGLARFSADVNAPALAFHKSRNASIGGDTVVADNDELGRIRFFGNDGTDFAEGARITALVNGTPGGGDMPTELVFATSADGAESPTARMAITSAGGVLIGTTSNSSIGEAGYRFIPGATGYSEFVRTGSDGSANIYIARGDNGRALSFFRNDSSNREVGTVTVTTNSTAYNTSSDYRLKENVNYDWDATTRLKQLKPARFNFILDADTTVDGFLAHEAQAVVPESVTGTKDAMRDEEYQVSAATGDIYTPATDAYVDEDGNDVDAVEEVIHSADAEQPETLADGQQWRETKPAVMGTRSVPVMQGIDQSKLVPLLVKTILELEARITALENA